MERAGMRPPSGSQVSARPPPVSNPHRATMPRRMRTPRRLATLPRVRLQPASLPLMLPTLVEEVPRGPGWLFELKWDGVRLLALREQGRVELWARSGARMTERYPEIAVALAPLAGGEFALGGYTDPKGTRALLGAVHLGVYDGDDLVYAGRAGSGLDRAGLDELAARLRPLVTERCPFTRGCPPRGPEHHWVRPALVCEVRFSEWTSDGLVRHPVYLGLRTDRRPRDVHAERPRSLSE